MKNNLKDKIKAMDELFRKINDDNVSLYLLPFRIAWKELKAELEERTVYPCKFTGGRQTYELRKLFKRETNNMDCYDPTKEKHISDYVKWLEDKIQDTLTKED